MKKSHIKEIIKNKFQKINNENIASFLNKNIKEVIQKLKEEGFEDINPNLKFEIYNLRGVADDNQEMGVSYSFDKDDLMMGDESDESIKPIKINGKIVYQVLYNI